MSKPTYVRTRAVVLNFAVIWAALAGLVPTGEPRWPYYLPAAAWAAFFVYLLLTEDA